MSLLEQIKAASLDARKQRQPYATFLVTLYSEAAMIGKNNGNRDSTDEEVIKVLKKFKTNAEETIKLLGHSDEKIEGELNLINKFLPAMLSSEELTVKIQGFVDTLEDKSPKAMKMVMAYLKATYPGLYDGSEASQIATKILSGVL